MSASREKKIRQELAAQGIPDIKEIRAAEERQQQRRSNILYGSLAALFVVIAAALVVWNSGIIQRGSTAISVDGEKYTAAEVNYYYNNIYSSTLSSDYASYMSLNSTTPLTQQVMSDLDLMLLGVSLPEGVEEMTWHDYFLDYTKRQLVSLTAVLKAAEKADFSFTEEMQVELDTTMSTLATYAQMNGVSTAAYLKSMFGTAMTEKDFHNLMVDAITVAHFQESYWNELSYTLDDLSAYYEENKDLFDVSSYDYVLIQGSAPSTTDANGNTVAATDAEKAAAKAKAEAAANDILARYQAGESLEKLAAFYDDIATFFRNEDVSYTGGTVQDWVYEADRQVGDVEVLNSSSTYYVVLFQGRQRNDYNPVNVRHILRMVDASALDVNADDYDAQLQILIDTAKVEADGLLAEWKAGAATAESFGELADKNTDDGGSKGNGGLYTDVPKGQMVPEFDEWIYDESRQVGDTDVIFVEASNYTGYHVMYFDGVGETPYWQLEVESTMRSNDYNEWYTALSEGMTAEEHSGMKYVG